MYWSGWEKFVKLCNDGVITNTLKHIIPPLTTDFNTDFTGYNTRTSLLSHLVRLYHYIKSTSEQQKLRQSLIQL